MTAEPASPLRIGYVLKKFPRLSETFILSEILGLEAAGREVFVFAHRAADDEPRHAALSRLRAPVALLPRGRDPESVAKAARGHRALHEFLGMLPPDRSPEIAAQGLALARRAEELRIDHLHAHFATVAAHIACVAHLAGGPNFSVTAHAKDLYRHTVDRSLFRAVAEHAAALVTVCDANRDWLLANHLRGSSARLIRIYNGQETESPPGEAVPVAPGQIVAVGRLVPKKGFDDLLAAASLLASRGKDFQLRILGHGEEAASLAERTRSLGLEGRVQFLGAVPHEQVLQEMRRATVVAAPCRRDEDGNQDALPTVLLEALRLGKAVVTTDVGGIREIVDDGIHGRIIAPRTPELLADALAEVLGDRGAPLRARAALEGPRRLAERFDRRQTVAELAAIFQGSRERSRVAP